MKAKYINSLINGFQKFLEKNTGTTNDAKKDHYVKRFKETYLLNVE